MKGFFVFALYCILYTVFFIPVSFGQGPSLSVSPLLIDHSLRNEKEFRLPIKVRNVGAEDLTLTLTPHQIEKQQKDGSLIYSKEPSASYKQLFATFTFDVEDEEIKELILPPQKEQIITLTGRVPDLQDYYFSLFLISKPLKKPLETSYSTVSTGVATHIFLSEKNTQNKDVSISKYSIPVLVQKPPIPIQLEVSNNESSVLKIGGKITITNALGKEVRRITLLPVYVLPNATRTMENLEEDTKSLAVLEWTPSFLFGPYTVTTELSDDKNSLGLRQSTLFLSLPTGFLIAISVIFVAFVYITNRVRAKLR